MSSSAASGSSGVRTQNYSHLSPASPPLFRLAAPPKTRGHLAIWIETISALMVTLLMKRITQCQIQLPRVLIGGAVRGRPLVSGCSRGEMLIFFLRHARTSSVFIFLDGVSLLLLWFIRKCQRVPSPTMASTLTMLGRTVCSITGSKSIWNRSQVFQSWYESGPVFPESTVGSTSPVSPAHDT